MKKIIAVFLSLIIILIFTGCSRPVKGEDTLIRQNQQTVRDVYLDDEGNIRGLCLCSNGGQPKYYDKEQDNLKTEGYNIQKGNVIILEKRCDYTDFEHKEYYFKVVGVN